MATDARKSAPTAGEVTESRRKSSSEKPSVPAPTSAAAASDAPTDKKLSNAEIKKKKQEEKQARRAQAKATQAPPQSAAAASSAGQAIADGAKTGGGKPNKQHKQQDSLAGGAAAAIATAAAGGGGGGHGKAAPAMASREVVRPSVPESFSHLSIAKHIGIAQADKDVHPTVLALGQQMAAFAISDSITRVEATLLAFKKVINSYTTPHNTTLSRHFTSHVLNPQIVYLTACRPMCFSMGNAIRWLKLQISKIDIDTSDSDAKKHLSEAIDTFINERITLADLVIVKTAADMIAHHIHSHSHNHHQAHADDAPSVILTYAHHHLVERTLLRARAIGKSFKVILVDDPFERTAGQAHAKRLSAAGIPVAYSTDFGALRTNLHEVTAVLVAAEAMFSNGAMFARAGTCDIATAASEAGVRVISLCETINFTERVSIDALTYNEVDPERNTDEEFRLLFDTTRDKNISAIVTELGICAAKSVPSIMRKFDEL